MDKKNIMLKHRILPLLILLINSFIHSEIGTLTIVSDTDLHNFSVIDAHVHHAGSDAFIRKVTDGKNIFILKQIRDSSMDEQFLLINDAIASTIGYQAGITVNEVFFIPYNCASHLKMYPEHAATLHHYIPGNDLENEFPSSLPSDFTIQQRVIDLQSPWQQKYPLDVHEQGFTKTIIESMSFHENLACIVALDIFTGNSDRSLPNIFYNQHNNGFYGIDQAAAFSKQLPMLACIRLNELCNERYFNECEPHIIAHLRICRDVLFFLKENIQPSRIIQSMQQLIPLVGNKAFQNNELQNRIKHHTFIIEQNYHDTMQLIMKLDQILPSHTVIEN